ncbi:GntR family transcriptional regulator [Pleurocapsa sp. FMAR1]
MLRYSNYLSPFKGELLPSEFELGVLFGVSKTTVRKAIA